MKTVWVLVEIIITLTRTFISAGLRVRETRMLESIFEDEQTTRRVSSADSRFSAWAVKYNVARCRPGPCRRWPARERRVPLRSCCVSNF